MRRTIPLAGDYSGLSVSGTLEVILDPNATELVATAPLGAHERLVAEVDNGRLRIDLADCDGEPVDVELRVPASTLRELDFVGAARVATASTMIAGSLSVRMRGTTSGHLELAVDELESSIAGTGRLSLRGEAGVHRAFLQGTVSLRALELHTGSSDIEIVGTGDAVVSAETGLEGRIIGTGTLRYHGAPAVRSRINGPGAIEAI